MVTGRARPRLVKVRKQFGRSRNGASEMASGFNPFRSKGEDSGPVNSGSSNASLQNNGIAENFNSEASVLNRFSVENSESIGFVFGTKRSDQVAENNKESVSNDVCERRERASEDEPQKLDKVGSVFGADFGNVRGNSNLERSKTSEATIKMGSGDERKMKLDNIAEFGNDSNMERGESIENSQIGIKLCSKSEKSECNRNLGDSGLGFVFGASWFNSASNLSSSESGSSQNNEKKVSSDQMKMNVENATESQGVQGTEIRFECNGRSWTEDYGHGVSVLGSGKLNSSCSNDCLSPKCPSAMNLNGKNIGNENILQTENDVLDCDVSDKSKFTSERSSNVATASSTDPIFKLPNEMKKLNINEYENGDGACNTYDSNNKFCDYPNTTSTFVFSSGVNPYSSSSGSSETTQRQKSGTVDAVERMAGDIFRTGDSDHIVFRNSCNKDNASFRTSSSKPSIFKAGLDKGHDSGFISSCKANADPQNLAAAPASLSSISLDFQPNDYGFESPSVAGVQKDLNSSHGLGVSSTEFITPNWDPSSFKANLYPKQNEKPEVSVKMGSLQAKRSKKTKRKLKKPSSLKQGLKQVHVPEQSSSQEHLNSPECYSPMDFSPYMETSVGDQPSKEASVTSNESFHADNIFAPSTSQSYVTTNSKDEKLATAGKVDFSIGDQKLRETNEETFGCCHGSSHYVDCPPKGFVFGFETAYSKFSQEQVYSSSGTTVASAEQTDGLNTEIPESVQNSFPSGVEDQKHFTFSASSTAEVGLTSRRRQLRKKSKKKVGNDSFIISPNQNEKFSFSSVNGRGEDKHISKSEVENKSEAAEQVKQGHTLSVASSQEICELWRLRGNQAYQNGNLSQAEEFYAQGIAAVPSSESAGCCIKPLVLCYSNRAATRISLGRMREALDDCVMALAMDPDFLKVCTRAAKCHLVLGEGENAVQYYNKLLESGTGVCLDRRMTIEAADGIQKAQKVAECTSHSAKLLEQKTAQAASDALEVISEALSISSYSEKLLQMKAEALHMLRKYQEAIQLCEQTLYCAEKNFFSVGDDNCSVNMDASGSVKYSLARLWRWHMISKSYFCMGKLEAALGLLQKLELVRCVKEKHGNDILESSTALAATIRELLHHKNAGNEAVQSGKYTEAVEHYTIALSSSIESRPFAAICFCNRAAALQALGHIADAIADCSVAMALDGNYTKAVSRRAVLHEMIRDYAQAASDLQRLVSILENQSDIKAKQSGSPSRSTGSKEIRQARQRMSLVEEEAKKGVPLDFYLILGVKSSDTPSDIKKAYRKAALRHHPDKAGQFLAKTESGDEGRIWKEIANEVQKDADRLFKMIGEAYAVLSETNKRSEYDLEEEIRKASKESHQSSPYGRSSYTSYTSRRSAHRQSRPEKWRTYGNSHSQW